MALYDPITGLPKQPRARSPLAAPRPNFGSLFAAPAPGPTNPGQQAGQSPGQPGALPWQSVFAKMKGYTPNYQELLENDPQLSQYRSDLAAQDVSDLAGAQEASRRALIQFGDLGALSGFQTGPLGDLIDPATQAAAEANTTAGLSITARLAKAHKDAIRNMKNQLAARGMLRSGELGYQLKEHQLRHTQGQYDARQQLLDYLTGVQRGYAEAQARRQREAADYTQRTAERYAQDDAYAPVPGWIDKAKLKPATWEGTGSAAGQPASDALAERLRRARAQRLGLE